ncbi:MAG: GreA/GreB family elongation factor [Kiritimatiellia bacterium]
MDKVAFGIEIQNLFEAETTDVSAVLDLIGSQLSEDAKGAIRAFVTLTETAVKAKNLLGVIACVDFYGQHSEELKGIDLAQMREIVRRSATTSEEKLLVDSIGLNTAIAPAIVHRLTVLLALKPGVYVSSQSWGFGQIQSIDTFYGKVIIDFEGKKGHTMSLAVAGQSLSVADDSHLMTRYLRNKDAIIELTKKHPAELVRLTLKSYGPLPVQRLADRLAEIGLVPVAEWKAFWEAARRGLKADKVHPVDIPTKRSEPLVLLDEAETFGDKWLKAFAKERDIKSVYDSVQNFLLANKGIIPDSYKETFATRLNFALKGADKVDYARYAQVAVLLRKLELSTPEEQVLQAETLVEKDEQDNILLAMHGLSARDVAALVGFLLAVKPELKPSILERIPVLNSVALGATLDALKGDIEVGNAVRALLARRSAPVPTLVVWALRNREAAEAWQTPALLELVMQAIHITEQRLTGENLKMRNALQAFFDSARWLEELCKQLTSFDRQVIFERIQASVSWETSSQRNILVRMARFDPSLNQLRRAAKAQEEHLHLTSLRSLTTYKLAYDHLINVEMPANVRDISTARSYGDLRENAEYQFAKDHQRVLLSKQDEMNRVLKPLKVSDFSGVSGEVAEPGTRVTVETAQGSTLYTILGELDRDEALNIISCRSRLAIALIGKRAGEKVEIPGEKGVLEATVKAIAPLDDSIFAWLSQIPTEFQPTNV